MMRAWLVMKSASSLDDILVWNTGVIYDVYKEKSNFRPFSMDTVAQDTITSSNFSILNN